MISKNVLVKVQVAILMVFAMASFPAIAAEKTAKPTATSTPHAVVEKVTSDMMDVIKAGEKALAENPKAYFTDVRETLEPVVSFDFIARSVMSKYWSQASEQQRKQFTEVFTESMVETLGKGMANYSDLNIKTLPAQSDTSSAKRVEVLQEVEAADGTSRISYTMARNRDNEWKLINVVLNGVNLGKSFRDQFVQAMKQNDNNIDKVVASWAKQG